MKDWLKFKFGRFLFCCYIHSIYGAKPGTRHNHKRGKWLAKFIGHWWIDSRETRRMIHIILIAKEPRASAAGCYLLQVICLFCQPVPSTLFDFVTPAGKYIHKTFMISFNSRSIHLTHLLCLGYVILSVWISNRR